MVLNYNIIDFYKSVLVGKKKLQEGEFNYKIESETWTSSQIGQKGCLVCK